MGGRERETSGVSQFVDWLSEQVRVEREGGRKEINPSVKFDGGLLIRLSLYADFNSVDHCRSIRPGNYCLVILILEVRFWPLEKLGILRVWCQFLDGLFSLSFHSHWIEARFWLIYWITRMEWLLQILICLKHWLDRLLITLMSAWLLCFYYYLKDRQYVIGMLIGLLSMILVLWSKYESLRDSNLRVLLITFTCLSLHRWDGGIGREQPRRDWTSKSSKYVIKLKHQRTSLSLTLHTLWNYWTCVNLNANTNGSLDCHRKRGSASWWRSEGYDRYWTEQKSFEQHQ